MDSYSGSMQEFDAAENARFRRLVLTCCPRAAQFDAGRFNLHIHPDDQMYTHSLREHRDVGAALSQYYNIALQQYDGAMQIIDALFAQQRERIEVLDFACGFGRLLRFLAPAMPGRVWASELQLDALDFVSQAFAVPTLPSAADPAAFQPGRSFDFIWVASLFSHLPEVLFHRWLARLHALLTPDGVLCFSVRDEALLGADQRMSATGILYQTQSENAGLSAEIYGTTYASEAFVRAAMQAVAGADCRYRRLPRSLSNEQDLYLLAANPLRDFSSLDRFRRGTWGWLDRRRFSADGELYLEGWAGSQDDGAAQVVEIAIDGVTHQLKPDIARPDVVAAFEDNRLTRSGWALRQRLPPEANTVWVEATARTADGSAALLYAGTMRRDDRTRLAPGRE